MKEIAILRRQVAESKDLSVPVNYFFDLMEKDILLKAKDHSIIKDLNKHSEILTAIKITENIVGDFFEKSLRLEPEFINFCPMENFYHGACRVLENHLPVLILFFADIQVGIIGITAINGKTDYFRFSVATLGVAERILH